MCLYSCRFKGETKNFKLYYDRQHFVGEKPTLILAFSWLLFECSVPVLRDGDFLTSSIIQGKTQESCVCVHAGLMGKPRTSNSTTTVSTLWGRSVSTRSMTWSLMASFISTSNCGQLTTSSSCPMSRRTRNHRTWLTGCAMTKLCVCGRSEQIVGMESAQRQTLGRMGFQIMEMEW